MSSRAPSRRRAFSITEAIVIVVVLAIAVPPTIAVLRDAAVWEDRHVRTTEARWFARSALETVLADVYADTSTIGFDGIADPSYLSALPGRMGDAYDFFTARGHSLEVSISERVGSDGAPANPGEDLYRYVTVIVRRTADDTEEARTAMLVADLAGAGGGAQGGNNGNQGNKGNGKGNKGNKGNGKGNKGNGKGNGGGNGTGNEGKKGGK